MNSVGLAEQKATKQELILDKEGMKQLWDSIDTSNIIGLRDRAYRTASECRAAEEPHAGGGDG